MILIIKYHTTCSARTFPESSDIGKACSKVPHIEMFSWARAGCKAVRATDPELNILIFSVSQKKLAGWWLTHPSEKHKSQLGWLFPTYGKKCSKPPNSWVLSWKIFEHSNSVTWEEKKGRMDFFRGQWPETKHLQARSIHEFKMAFQGSEIQLLASSLLDMLVHSSVVWSKG